MKEFTYVIKDPMGIHARPAGMLVKAAAGFKSTVTVSKDGKDADAKKIFGIMGLAVKQGQEIVVKCDGEDEDAAVAAMKEFFEANL